MMRIDVVIPTYNRAEQLEKAVRSLLDAPLPSGLARRVLIVDNNSTDHTAAVVARLLAAAPDGVIGLTEQQQGRSAALNAGIRASDADLVGFIDDDETVSGEWFRAVADTMKNPSIGFMGGPVDGDWQVEAPAWIPPDRPGVLGVVSHGPVPREYGQGFPGILLGGNCVIRRGVFATIGAYSTQLGRTAAGLLSGEDDDMYLRLLEAGVRGVYVPALQVYHFVPAARVTKRYFRSWSFWKAVSHGIWLRGNREPVAYFAGIPRYNFATALRGLAALPRRKASERFSGELEVWSLAGLFYGRYLARMKQNSSGPS